MPPAIGLISPLIKADWLANPDLRPRPSSPGNEIDEAGCGARDGQASASAIGMPGSNLERRIASEVLTLSTFGAAVSSLMMKS